MFFLLFSIASLQWVQNISFFCTDHWVCFIQSSSIFFNSFLRLRFTLQKKKQNHFFFHLSVFSLAFPLPLFKIIDLISLLPTHSFSFTQNLALSLISLRILAVFFLLLIHFASIPSCWFIFFHHLKTTKNRANSKKNHRKESFKFDKTTYSFFFCPCSSSGATLAHYHTIVHSLFVDSSFQTFLLSHVYTLRSRHTHTQVCVRVCSPKL